MDRNRRIEIADETNEILRRKTYEVQDPSDGGDLLVDLTEILDDACHGTELHMAEDPLNIPPIVCLQESDIYMTSETTFECLHRLHNEGARNVVVLNFASPKNPGGGLNRGSWEQEEYIVASTGLLPCLSTPQAKPFYDIHKKLSKPGKGKPSVLIYTSNIVYAPHVPVFRRTGMELMDEPFTCNVISASCVNYNAGMLSKKISKEEEAASLLQMQARVLRVLQVAIHHGAETLILGAWGCGINKNSPREVAKAFSVALLHHPDMEGRFKEVVFAVPYDESSNVYKHFSKTFTVAEFY